MRMTFTRSLCSLFRHNQGFQGAVRWGPLLFVFLAAACAQPNGNGAVPEARIAVIDAQRVLNESVPGKKAKETLATFTKNRQALIELEERDLRRMEEDFVKQNSVLSAGAKREREEAFRRRMADYQQKAAEMNREVQEKQKEVLEAFRERLEQVVERMAKQLGVQVVVERGRGTPTIYNDASLDISERVIEELNKE